MHFSNLHSRCNGSFVQLKEFQITRGIKNESQPLNGLSPLIRDHTAPSGNLWQLLRKDLTNTLEHKYTHKHMNAEVSLSLLHVESVCISTKSWTYWMDNDLLKLSPDSPDEPSNSVRQNTDKYFSDCLLFILFVNCVSRQWSGIHTKYTLTTAALLFL